MSKKIIKIIVPAKETTKLEYMHKNKASRFFDDVETFIAQIAASSKHSGCWKCTAKQKRVFLNVAKDLLSLGANLDDRDIPLQICLCLQCSGDYMNSFNKALTKHQEIN